MISDSILVYFTIQNFVKKSDDISLKYGDKMIFKMAVFRHLIFKKI